MEAAQQILTINTNLAKEIEEITQEDHGKLRFGVPVQRGMQVLPYVLPKFFKMYPYVDVEVFEQGSGLMENMVLDGTVDMACMTTTARHTELKYILVENEDLVLLTSKTRNWLNGFQTALRYRFQKRAVKSLSPTNRATA